MPPLRPDHLERPRADRLDPAHPRYADVLDAHAAAVRLGITQYRDPISGWLVFTAAALAERGTCCDAGCRHCPYVPRLS